MGRTLSDGACVVAFVRPGGFLLLWENVASSAFCTELVSGGNGEGLLSACCQSGGSGC